MGFALAEATRIVCFINCIPCFVLLAVFQSQLDLEDIYTPLVGLLNGLPIKPSVSNDVIPYGSSFGSGLNRGKRIPRIVHSMFVLPSYLFQVVLGLILGDGWVEKGGANWNARFGFKQSIIHTAFLIHVWSLFWPFCASKPTETTTKDKRTGKTYLGVEFKTRAMVTMNILREAFYPNGVKVLPISLLIFMDETALAYWIMADGSYEKGGLILCTDNFTMQEVCSLIGLLHYNFGFDCTLRETEKGHHRIYIKRSSMPHLRALVGSFLFTG